VGITFSLLVCALDEVKGLFKKMMNVERVLLLQPVFGSAIWGDGSIIKRYPSRVPKDIKKDNIASIRAFSGHPQGSNTIISGSHKGKTLYELYQEVPELFGREEERRWEVLPVMIGVCHAAEDLSVQVHPREDYALAHENSHGKAECWYIVDCDKDTEVVLGHRARSLEELDTYIKDSRFEELVLKKPVEPGAFFNLEAGTLHALQKSTTFIEVCTCCTITYRFYDYMRRDRDGNFRRLDIDKARDNILVPYEDMTYNFRYCEYGDVSEKELTDNPNFSVRLYDVKGRALVPKKKPYLACFVVEGSGKVNGTAIEAGNSFLLTSQVTAMELEGNMRILAAHG